MTKNDGMPGGKRCHPDIHFFINIDQFEFYYFYEFVTDSYETSSYQKIVKA